MHARVMSGLLQPGKRDEAVAIYRDQIVPAAREQAGFASAVLLTDPDTGKWMSVTLWETEDDMEAGEVSGYLQAQVAKFAPTLAGAPVREHYEVDVRAQATD